MPDATNGPFCLAATAWLDMIERAKAVKNIRFQPEAEEGRKFFSGPYDFFFEDLKSGKNFRMPNSQDQEIIVCYNKVAELVQIFSPVLYHRNPTRRLTSREVPKIDPNILAVNPQLFQMVQQVYQASMQEQMTDKAIGALFEAILNVTPHKMDLKSHSRQAIDESLITGMGLLWHDYKTSPSTGRKTCGSFYGSVQDFLIDPDADNLDNIKWCSRSTLMHRWEAERRWRLPQGVLHGSRFSANGLASQTAGTKYNGSIEADLVEVIEIWSKMGCGGRLPHCRHTEDEYKVAYEMMGDFCYMVVVPGHPWPLNLPPWMFQQNPNAWQQAQSAVQWPTPFWIEDQKAWPFTAFYYHTIAKDPWPMSHLTPGMGYLKFLNWGMAKIASKISVTSRDLVFMPDTISEEVEKVIKFGADLSVCKLQGMEGKDIREIIQLFQHNVWNPDMWKVMQAVSEAFEQSTGLSELMYGNSSRQMRSAEESARKYEQVNVRPDDMANKVEDAMSAAAEREKWCSRWHYSTEDVHSLCGIAAAFAWEMLVLSQPPERVLDLQARIESDSSKKPNKGLLTESMQQAMQNLVQPLFTAAQSGMMEPFNSLISDWLDSIGVPDKERYLLQLPPNVPIPVDPNAQAATEAKAKASKAA